MKTEIGAALIFIVACLFKILHWAGGDFLLVISLSLWTLIYFPAAFYFFCDKKIKQQNIILSVTTGLFLFIIPMGILFKLMHWKGNEHWLAGGFASAIVFLIITLIARKKSEPILKSYYRNMLIRIITMVFLAFWFMNK